MLSPAPWKRAHVDDAMTRLDIAWMGSVKVGETRRGRLSRHELDSLESGKLAKTRC